MVWATFWAHAVQSDALPAELRERYADWTALLAGLIGAELDNIAVTSLVASIGGLGTRIALDPGGVPDVEQGLATVVELAISAADPSTRTT